MIATTLPEGWKCDAKASVMFSKLEARLRPEIASRARKAQAMGVAEFDDAVQEGRLALLNVVARFDPERGDLEHYARKALRIALALSIRKTAEAKARGRTVSLQPIHEERKPEHSTPERLLLDKEFVRAMSTRAEKCNERERLILGLRLEGLKRSEICRRLGLTKIQGEWAAGTLRRRFEILQKEEATCHG